MSRPAASIADARAGAILFARSAMDDEDDESGFIAAYQEFMRGANPAVDGRLYADVDWNLEYVDMQGGDIRTLKPWLLIRSMPLSDTIGDQMRAQKRFVEYVQLIPADTIAAVVTMCKKAPNTVDNATLLRLLEMVQKLIVSNRTDQVKKIVAVSEKGSNAQLIESLKRALAEAEETEQLSKRHRRGEEDHE